MVQPMGTAVAFFTDASRNSPSSEGALADICMSSEGGGSFSIETVFEHIFDCPGGSRPLVSTS